MTPVAVVWLAAAAFAGVFGTLRPPPPRVRQRALRPRKHDAGGLVDRERRLPLGHRRPRRADLPPRLALRPDPGCAGAALVGVAGSRAAARRAGGRRRRGRDPGLLARAQAPRLGVAGCCARRRLPRLSAGAMADHERLPSGRARLPAPPLAWWHLDERRLWAFALLAAARSPTKEHVGLAVAAMGVWYAVRYRSPRHGRRDRPPGRRRGARRDARRRAALRARPDPRRSRAATTRLRSTARDLTYLASLLFPLALPSARSLRSPLLAAVPELGLNLLSSTLTQTSVEDALRRRGHSGALRRRGLRRRAAGLAARVLRRADGGRRDAPARPAGPRGDLGADEHDAAARRALAIVPDGVPVSATNSLGAHLSDRRRIFSFPVLREADVGRRRRDGG